MICLDLGLGEAGGLELKGHTNVYDGHRNPESGGSGDIVDD